jgi:hypothetical protein
MIVVRLSDGLGNQMFQYALGRRLALATDQTLKLDLSWFEERGVFGGTERTVTLDGFDVVFDPATEDDVAAVIGNRRLATLLRRHGYLLERAPWLPARLFDYYREVRDEPTGEPSWPHRRRFHPAILDITGDAYLDGYWQSHRYVEEIRDVLLEEFRVSDPLTGSNERTADRIDATTAVGVHVRRGDQLDRGPESDEFGNAERPSYYRRATEYVARRIDDGEAHAFVFSDDPEWCRAELDLDHPTTVVDQNDGSTDYEDVRLLRRCDHHVVASSTFSWWGAWLCESDDQIVIAPRPWKRYGYADGVLDDWDLLPENWVLLRD